MTYHLCRDGRNVGVFPLDDLHRRRLEGELSENDFVWCEGMAAWEPLDSVLRAKGKYLPPIAFAPSIRPPAKNRNKRLLTWIAAGAAAILVLFLALAALVTVGLIRQAQQSALVADEEEPIDPADIAGKRISSRTNSPTEATVKERGRQFRIRQYAEGYKKNGNHDQPCDAEAIRFVNDWIEFDYGRGTNLSAIQAEANKLVAQPECDDPLVMTVAALVCVEEKERARRVEKALAEFPKSKHKAYAQLRAVLLLESELERGSPRIAELDKQAVRLVKKAFTDGSFQPADSEEIAEIFVNGWGKSFFGRNGSAIYQEAQDARGFVWLGLVLEGQYHVDEAWKVRGSDWAESVSEKGWKAFEEHLTRARTVFSEAWDSHHDRPLPAACMIEVAMGESGAEEMRRWFDRAVAAQIDYPQAWSAMRWGLRPRWHGSEDAMLALGVSAVETKRFDTDVPRKFFDVVSDLEREQGAKRGEHIYGREDIWPSFQRMYEGYIAEPSEKDQRDGWRSTYAAVAFLAGKHEVARKQLEVLNWKPLPQNLTGWGTDLSLMPLKVAALTGKSGTRVTRAETSADQLDFADAIKTYTEVSNSSDADERTRRFSQARLCALKQEQTLARGEWVDFLPADENDANWVMNETTIRRMQDGAIEMESDNRSHSLYSRTQVGPEFEVSGEFEVVRSSDKAFQAGLLMGLPDSRNSIWYAFRIKRNATEGEGVSFSRGWRDTGLWMPTKLEKDKNTFKFRLQGGRADAWVNGKQVLYGAAVNKDMHLGGDCMIGLGGSHDANDTVIRYRNVKVRRLLPDR